MRASSLYVFSTMLLSMSRQVKAGGETNFVVETDGSSSACGRFTRFCEDFTYQMYRVVEGGARTLVNAGEVSVQATVIAGRTKSCTSDVGKHGIIDCMVDGFSSRLKAAFAADTGDSPEEFCSNPWRNKVFGCNEYAIDVSADRMSRDACTQLGRGITDLQNQCANTFTALKAWLLPVAIGVPILCVAGCCFAAYQYRANKKRQRAMANLPNFTSAAHQPPTVPHALQPSAVAPCVN